MVRSQSCPICKKALAPAGEQTASTFPFCSERCRNIDFFRWSDGRYSIVEPLDPNELNVDIDEAQMDESYWAE
jgi:uncharacterized protein